MSSTSQTPSGGEPKKSFNVVVDKDFPEVEVPSEIAQDEDDLADLQRIYDRKVRKARAERERKAEEERLEQERLEQERLERERIERERIAREAEEERERERERLASIERTRLAEEARELARSQELAAQVEADRLARVAEAERLNRQHYADVMMAPEGVKANPKKAEARKKAKNMSKGKSPLVKAKVHGSLTASLEEVDLVEEREKMAKDAKKKRKPLSRVSFLSRTKSFLTSLSGGRRRESGR
jgi:hypothetical protein